MSNRANKLRKILVWFSLVVLFVSETCFQQFHISLPLLFCVFALKTFHITRNRSIVANKSLLAHVFKLKIKLTSTLAKDLRSKSLNANHLVTAYTSKNMIRGTWLDVSFSSHVKKVIRDIWLPFSYLDQLMNEHLFRAFSMGKSQYVYNKCICSF